MRTATGFDGRNTVGWQRFVSHEKFGVLFGKDVICDDAELDSVPQGPT
jgi:hypothetical protein